jgi:nitrite reductase (cytochrome c-552)
MWSQGIHARAGVACADCHMPYQRQGALKVSDHWVRSPLLNVARACQPCHSVPEAELLARVATIQDRTHALMDRAAAAAVDMLDAIVIAQRGGASAERLAEARALQRKAQWRLDFVNAENSMGFHADQESARVLAEAIDFARLAERAAARR